MLKLYKFDAGKKLYWETWQDDRDHILHWGELGTRGETEVLKPSFDLPPIGPRISDELGLRLQDGFREIPMEDHARLIIEYPLGDEDIGDDIDKRYRLEDRMNQLMGWTGLGACDGGSYGWGTMEVCCFVVDFEVAKSVIEGDLTGSEFSDYGRIYNEDA